MRQEFRQDEQDEQDKKVQSGHLVHPVNPVQIETRILNPRSVPILLYHDLESPECPSDKADAAGRDTVVPAENFTDQMAWLAEQRYQTMSLGDFFAPEKTGTGQSTKRIVVTFDDGHISNYNLAFPRLLEQGFIATFFIITDRIDQNGYLSAAQVREMADAGMEFGSHGCSHRYFPLLSEAELARELRESKEKLQDITGQIVDFLAYPGGHYNKKVLSLTQACGYKGACSCLYGVNGPDTSPFLLRRMEVRRRVNVADFARYFKTGNRIVYQSLDRMKRLVKQTVGLERYTALRANGYRYYFFKK